jgi:hypothetical protein
MSDAWYRPVGRDQQVARIRSLTRLNLTFYGREPGSVS